MTTQNTKRITILSRREITPRLMFAMKLIGLGQTGEEPVLLVDEAQFMQSEGLRFVYGAPKIPDIPMIPATTLLFETGTGHPTPEIELKHGMPVLFSSDDSQADLPFDYPAALFWLLSRYEEYQSFTPDAHGRFHAGCSLLYRHNLLLTPIVEVWEQHFTTLLKTFQPGFQPLEHQYRFIPTIDVDSAWAYRHKPLFRQAGGLMKACFKGQFNEAVQRTWAILGLRKDPYDTFGHILQMHQGIEQPIWFFLLGTYNAHNKNPHPHNRHYRKLIRNLSGQCDTGLHPSYETSETPGLFDHEVEILTRITGKKVIRSRQHFLRFRVPDTYRSLVRTGIREEYSMGFADAPGFRAGTCRPFPFYDLEADQETPLTIYPLAIMDGTLHDYLVLDPETASDTILSISTIIKHHRGTMVTLWHNSSFDQNTSWKGWNKVYELLLSNCTYFTKQAPHNTIINPNNHHNTP